MTTASLRIRILVAAALALQLSACAVTTPQADARFGQSLRATLAAQVIDPAAARDARPVNGLDGRAATSALTHYEHSFEPAPPAPPMIVIAK